MVSFVSLGFGFIGIGTDQDIHSLFPDVHTRFTQLFSSFAHDASNTGIDSKKDPLPVDCIAILAIGHDAQVLGKVILTPVNEQVIFCHCRNGGLILDHLRVFKLKHSGTDWITLEISRIATFQFRYNGNVLIGPVVYVREFLVDENRFSGLTP